MDILEVMEKFPDQQACISHIEKVRWGDNPKCPHCDGTHVGRRKEIAEGRLGRWNCHDCKVTFKVVHGTLFHGTKIPLQKWFLGISLMMNAKKSLSSCQFARDLDLNQKTAWYMQTRIRAEMASQESGTFLKGIIEADETYIGGKPRKKNKKTDRDDAPPNPRGRGTKKAAIVGAVQRGGKVVASMMERVTGRELVKFITHKVKELKDSVLISDEYTAYKEVGKKIDHKVINHSEQFVDGETFYIPLRKVHNMIPLISSICYGTIGICHLPRFWWKVLLRKSGLLDAEYPDCSNGLDRLVIEALGLDKETVLAYLRDNMPSYLEFEAWVLQQKGGTLDENVVNQWNERVRTRVHRPEKIVETYADIGFSDDVDVNSAVILNSLQDWQLFYKRDLDSLSGQVIPLIATIDYGPLEVCQLPRTWLKNLLKAKGALHPDYPNMAQSGLDARVLQALQIEPDDAVAYIHNNLPTYVQFEEWVLEQKGGKIDRGPVEQWNTFVRTRIHADSKRVEIHCTVGREEDGTLTSAVVLNHIEDWHFAYVNLMEKSDA